jgi:SAM-dependent methyltransferase
MIGPVDMPTVAVMTTTDIRFDPARVEAFAGRLMPILAHGLLSHMIDLGDRTGLFAAAAQGPGTSQEIADRAGLQERYVREWLGAMVTSDIVDYDAASDTYLLSPEHAVLLTGPGSMAPLAHGNTTLGSHIGGLAEVFRSGGGIPYADYTPDFSEAMDAMSRGGLDRFLLSDIIPLAPGLTEKLSRGARVADFACGSGHALVVLGSAFPSSEFVGYDLDEIAIGRGRREAAECGLDNVTFQTVDITTVTAEPRFDAVLMFDALHDQVDPEGALAAIHGALADDGVFLLREPHAGDSLAENIGSFAAPVQYSISTLHCLTVSLAQGGAGIGTAFGEKLARRLLTEAGFADPEVHPAPGDPIRVVYVTHPNHG